MNRIALCMIASLMVLVGLVWLLVNSPATAPAGRLAADRTAGDSPPVIAQPLQVACAASNRAVMERIRIAFEQETGRIVQVQYGASQSLLAAIELAGQADLYIPADESYLQLAKSKGLISQVHPLAKMRPILAVRKGNPKQIRSIDDLLQAQVRLVQANPDAAAIGMLTRQALRGTGQWDAIDQATVAYTMSVSDVANDLKLGSADAGFIYDVMLKTYPELEAVPVAALQEVTALVAIGIVNKHDGNHLGLDEFVRYLRARDRGLAIYAEEGFEVVAGEPWLAVDTVVPSLSDTSCMPQLARSYPSPHPSIAAF